MHNILTAAHAIISLLAGVGAMAGERARTRGISLLACVGQRADEQRNTLGMGFFDMYACMPIVWREAAVRVSSYCRLGGNALCLCESPVLLCSVRALRRVRQPHAPA